MKTPLMFKGNLPEVMIYAVMLGLVDAGHPKEIPWLTTLSNVVNVVMRILWIEDCSSDEAPENARMLAARVWELGKNDLDSKDEETVSLLERARMKIGECDEVRSSL